jgi:hypothetical protein
MSERGVALEPKIEAADNRDDLVRGLASYTA